MDLLYKINLTSRRVSRWLRQTVRTAEGIISTNLPSSQDLYSFRVRKYLSRLFTPWTQPVYMLFSCIQRNHTYTSTLCIWKQCMHILYTCLCMVMFSFVQLCCPRFSSIYISVCIKNNWVKCLVCVGLHTYLAIRTDSDSECSGCKIPVWQSILANATAVISCSWKSSPYLWKITTLSRSYK